mmetsp:Transcript_52639/g.61450  ORF Transcript_52639/g.61450 Transcript_52639/m.61450 type:complete len:825 (-) Transcript_52639:341-2815(-)
MNHSGDDIHADDSAVDEVERSMMMQLQNGEGNESMEEGVGEDESGYQEEQEGDAAENSADHEDGEDPTQEEINAMMMEDENGVNEDNPEEEVEYDDNGLSLDEEHRLALAAGEVDGEEEEMADCALDGTDDEEEQAEEASPEISSPQQDHQQNDFSTAPSPSTKTPPENAPNGQNGHGLLGSPLQSNHVTPIGNSPPTKLSMGATTNIPPAATKIPVSTERPAKSVTTMLCCSIPTPGPIGMNLAKWSPNPGSSAALHIPQGHHVCTVSSVTPNGQAALAGIRAGDTFVTDAWGKTNATFEQVMEWVRNSPRPLQLFVRRVLTVLNETPSSGNPILDREQKARAAAMLPGRKSKPTKRKLLSYKETLGKKPAVATKTSMKKRGPYKKTLDKRRYEEHMDEKGKKSNKKKKQKMGEDYSDDEENSFVGVRNGYQYLSFTIPNSGSVGITITSSSSSGKTGACSILTVTPGGQAEKLGMKPRDVFLNTSIDSSSDDKPATFDQVMDWITMGNRPLTLCVRRRLTKKMQSAVAAKKQQKIGKRKIEKPHPKSKSKKFSMSTTNVKKEDTSSLVTPNKHGRSTRSNSNVVTGFQSPTAATLHSKLPNGLYERGVILAIWQLNDRAKGSTPEAIQKYLKTEIPSSFQPWNMALFSKSLKEMISKRIIVNSQGKKKTLPELTGGKGFYKLPDSYRTMLNKDGYQLKERWLNNPTSGTVTKDILSDDEDDDESTDSDESDESVHVEEIEVQLPPLPKKGSSKRIQNSYKSLCAAQNEYLKSKRRLQKLDETMKSLRAEQNQCEKRTVEVEKLVKKLQKSFETASRKDGKKN